jgi:hypothetical protein
MLDNLLPGSSLFNGKQVGVLGEDAICCYNMFGFCLSLGA